MHVDMHNATYTSATNKLPIYYIGVWNQTKHPWNASLLHSLTLRTRMQMLANPFPNRTQKNYLQFKSSSESHSQSEGTYQTLSQGMRKNFWICATGSDLMVVFIL